MDPNDAALRLAALEREVAFLRAEVDAMRAGRVPTLRARWGAKPSAPLAVWACTSCGFVEWYVTTFEEVEVDGVLVRDASAPTRDEGGPYR